MAHRHEIPDLILGLMFGALVARTIWNWIVS